MNPSPAANDWPFSLKDHATIHIRRLVTDDYDAVVRLAIALTDRERYLRFFTTHPGYLDEWARSLTEPGDPEQYALGAYEGDMLVGVANYNKTNRPGSAEASVVVAHDQHDRGVGTALLQVLAVVARRDGIHHLVADVLAENHSMQRVVADAGWACSHRQDGCIVCYDVDLDQPDVDQPD
jgi:RimJ/RimL family protein N-acetyltransferase